jgi:phenylalanyl-tRNA synthetase beta chain
MPGFGKEFTYTMDDVVVELDNKFITNRPDLFSVAGNAREIACIGKTDFENPVISVYKPSNELGVKIVSDAVINYLLFEYTIPEIPETPFIIQTLLSRAGQGMHGFLADLTNLIMTGIGQPMHVFDADTVRGDIVLRMAKDGEQFTGLDNKTYTLTSEDLVIVDDEKVLALAGIMGGLAS